MEKNYTIRYLSCLIINGMGDAASGLISMFVVSPAFLFTVKERRNVVKFLKKLDHIVEFVVGNLAGILLIVMMIMVNLTIFSRWVFNINMHGYEELPTILFIVFVWLGVILVVRDDNMLKVDFFLNLCKTEKSKEALHLFSCFFGALCGSALATANTLSTAMVPELEKKGYDKAYLAALIAASSPFGFMIPPNVNAIIFASVSSASVGALFMATIVPGLIWAGLYLIINRIIYIKYYHPEYAGKTVASVSACTEDNEPKEESEKNARETISRNRFFLELVVAVLMPVIVLGGIYGGIFTATEAGAITCLYGAIMGVVVYKKLSLVQLMGVFSKGVKDVSALVIMFPMTLIFSRLMTLNHIPELVAELMLGITNNRIGLILLIDLLLFFIGFFLDGNVIILTLVPLLTPIATACGIDTIQLAVIVFVSIGIGSITPPMATCLMACSRVCDVPIHKLIKPILPFLLFGALPILLLVSFVPVVSTWLPGLFYSF